MWLALQAGRTAISKWEERAEKEVKVPTLICYQVCLRANELSILLLESPVPCKSLPPHPVVNYGCESWIIKKAEHWRIDAFELWCWRRLLRVPWAARSNQSWISIGRTDTEAETPILWPPDANNWLIGKDLDAGKDWRQEEKGMTEDKMVGWHHRLDGDEFE